MSEGSLIRPQRALVSIDLLRFAAATMVMLHHYTGQWSVLSRLSIAPNIPLSSSVWLQSGWVGVEIFFVISGYVIAMSAKRGGAADFVRRRALRLWPSALICASTTALVLGLAGASVGEIFPGWLYSAALWPSSIQIDPAYWSLGVEIAFYLLVAVLLAARRFDPIALGFWLGSWSLIYWAAVVGEMIPAPAIDRLAELSLTRFGAMFALGVLIHAWHAGTASLRIWHLAPAIVTAPFIICWHALEQHNPPYAALTMFGTAMIAVLLTPTIERRITSSRLQRTAVVLGVATYPLYLIHQFVGEVVMQRAEVAGFSAQLTILPMIAAMIAVAIFLAMKVEPLLRGAMNSFAKSCMASAPRWARGSLPEAIR